MKDTIQESLNAQSSKLLNQLYTSIPCIVVAVHLDKQMVDIQPSINQKFLDGSVAERPPILGVPISFPASKTAAFTFPIKVGDTGLAVFSMRNLDAWKSGSGYPTTPLNQAKFDKGDAIFYPGIQPPSVAINNPEKRFWEHSTDDVVVVNNIGTAEEAEVRIKPSGNVIINTKAKVEVNCNEAQVIADTSLSLSTAELTVNAINTTWYGNINLVGNLIQNGNYTSTGVMSFNGIDFSTHKHTGVDAGPDTSGGPTN